MATASSQSSLDSKIASVCNIIRRDAPGAMEYVPEVTWMLFLRILDEKEELEQAAAQAVGASFTPSLSYPYRWRDWASPSGQKRRELQDGMAGDVFKFFNKDLLPYLQNLRNEPSATSRQRVISQVMSGVDGTRLQTERNFLDAIDKVDDIRQQAVDNTHTFTISQAYEKLLLAMGEKNNDGGQFFTPREVIRAIIKVVNPQIDETVYDPACGTGGFLAQSYEYIKDNLRKTKTDTPDQMDTLTTRTFYGREKAPDAFSISIANMVLHDIDEPHIWRGNTLTRNENYGDLFRGAPELFDVILMNPPFGGKEGKDAQTRYAYRTGSTQVLFLQEIIDSLAPNGRAGIVVDEGLLFRTSEKAFVQTKRKLLDECDLYCIVSLPGGVFTQAGAGVKTNLLFFNKGTPTEKIWYYDLSEVKITKRKPLVLSHFDEFFEHLPSRADSPNSWTVTRTEIEDNNYDLKAVNPNRVEEVDTRTPEELLNIIEQTGKDIQQALKTLRGS